MAGIGFVLRKLAGRDDLSGILQGYFYSAIVSSGPWLMTVLVVGMIMVLTGKLVDYHDMASFRIIIIYNFAFSLVFSAPVYMLATRYLADAIYAKDVSEAPGLLIKGMLILLLTQIPIVIGFYGFYVNLGFSERLAAIANYFLISGIWLISVFLSALKNYQMITITFFLGLLLALGLSVLFANFFSVTGMLFGFSLGLMVILFAMTANIFAEYPFSLRKLTDIRQFIRRHWQLAVSGTLYNIAIWIDKWVMWFAPEREMLSNRMISYPDYDTAMFLAYLSIVPAMAFFVFSIETRFFEGYLRYYRDILEHATFTRIQKNQKNLIQTLLLSSRNLLILQISLTLLILLISPQILAWLGITSSQLGMFRLGVLGSMFHIFTLFISIILSYFDCKGRVMLIYLLFMLSNGLLSWGSMQMGFPYYGYGYFLSGLITFAVSFMILANFILELPYQSFIRLNSAIS